MGAANYHPVSPMVWDRRMRELSDHATVLRLHIMTCPQRLSEGLFYLPLGMAEFATGLTSEQTDKGLAELIEAGLVSYDHDAEVVLDRTALKYTPLNNVGTDSNGNPKPDNRIKGAVTKFGQVPDTPLRVEFYHLAREHSPVLADYLLKANPNLYQGPTEPLEAPSKGQEAPSRDELGRGEVETGNSQRPQCHWCGDLAMLLGAGQVEEREGNPWCGWCGVEA